MASIPLVALQSKSPEPINIADEQAKVQAIQNQQAQGQMNQLQLQQAKRDAQDQEIIRQAYMSSNGDLSAAADEAARRGASPKAVLSLRAANLDAKSKALDLVTKQGAVAVQQADLAKGAHAAVDAAKPEDKPAMYQQQLQGLQQAGVDVSKFPPEYPGDEAFKFIGTHVQGYSKLIDEAAKTAGINKDNAEAAAAPWKDAGGVLTNVVTGETKGTVKPAQTDSTRFTSDYLASHGLEDTPANRQKAFAAFTKMTKTDPGVQRAEIYLQRPVEAADPNNPGQTVLVPQSKAAGMAGKSSASVTVPKAMETYMTSGKGGQQLTAFNTAISHLDLLDKLSLALNNTDVQVVNKAKQRWAQETGGAAPANFEAAKNAMSGEVAAALKTSGATDQEISKVGDTFNRAQSPMQLKGAINTYRTLLKSKAGNLKGQNDQGMQGKPNFGGPKAGDIEDGYKFKGGNPADPNAWEKQ